MVAIAVEVLPKGFGRIRIQRLDRGNQQNLQSFIKETVEPGSKVHSDGSGAYRIARIRIPVQPENIPVQRAPLFYRLLQQAVATAPVTYNDVVASC